MDLKLLGNFINKIKFKNFTDSKSLFWKKIFRFVDIFNKDFSIKIESPFIIRFFC